jgi:calcium/calmodulin-dependent 3',5'-cyclic nucleotide phosphodiesterase
MNDVSENQALRYVGFELMSKFNLLSKFKVMFFFIRIGLTFSFSFNAHSRSQIQNLVMQNFLEAMEGGYSKYNNPYHNLVHSTDVLQTTYHMLNNAGLMVMCSFHHNGLIYFFL